MKKVLSLATFILLAVSSIAFAKEVILDVRTPQEFEQEHIPQALNIDIQNANFKTEIAKLAKEDSYKLYCRSGRRSGLALSSMKEMGFKNLENLGGLEDAKKTLKTSK
ncbi:Thiosulfate sulfurtransferase PspE precursor [compost metagenome]